MSGPGGQGPTVPVGKALATPRRREAIVSFYQPALTRPLGGASCPCPQMHPRSSAAGLGFPRRREGWTVPATPPALPRPLGGPGSFFFPSILPSPHKSPRSLVAGLRKREGWMVPTTPQALPGPLGSSDSPPAFHIPFRPRGVFGRLLSVGLPETVLGARLSGMSASLSWFSHGYEVDQLFLCASVLSSKGTFL